MRIRAASLHSSSDSNSSASCNLIELTYPTDNYAFLSTLNKQGGWRSGNGHSTCSS